MISMLKGMNFKLWKEIMEIILGCMDLDLALRMEKLTSTTKNPNVDNIEKWEHSKCMCLIIMKRSISEVFRGSITESTGAKRFFKEIEQYFAKKEKAEMSNALAKLITMRYKGNGNIREYTLEMSNLARKLKALKLELFDDFHMHLEERLQREKTDSAHLASTSQNKRKKRAKDIADE
ncbi:uncharacterized protein LOC133303741 [Gastrolobium bilobum]|uniref:uncharacterized protein LOC133303741 n=1 Tax=Gastrolobium bilobum TaxID=150636 RepID=UPI002AB13708|nr:uncharacterized protein LOC133303741 [Gastrolobium bilobum]